MSFIPPPCLPDADVAGSCGCSAEAEVERVSASTSTTLLAAANPLRRGLVLWNDSTATAYVKFGDGASNTDFTWKIGSQSGYESPIPIYQGNVTAVWEAANGAMQVTELV